jgi:hypothetical protein
LPSMWTCVGTLPWAPLGHWELRATP